MAWDSLMDLQGSQSQKECQEGQGAVKVKELGGYLPGYFKLPGSSWLSFWLWAPWKTIIKLSQAIKLRL